MSGFGGRGRGGGGGRGEYYKNKYGGGRGGRGRGGGNHSNGSSDNNINGGGNNGSGGGPYSSLITLIRSINNQQYPRYHSIESPVVGWRHDLFTLKCNRTQSDPYARPTSFQLIIPSGVVRLPQRLYAGKTEAVASADFLLRRLYSWTVRNGVSDAENSGNWGGVKGGDIQVQKPSQMIIETSALVVQDSTLSSCSRSVPPGSVVLNLTINLPARGRTILGDKACEIFQRILPTMVSGCLIIPDADDGEGTLKGIHSHVACCMDQEYLRGELPNRGLIGFVCNGSVLPRASGDNDGPMVGSNVEHFVTPPELAVEFDLPFTKRRVRGMGVRRGVTLIVGGGFHGKSTLLSALQTGIYNKIPKDGRELIVSEATATKVKSEEGRRVSNSNIYTFIKNVPQRDRNFTKSFSTNDASGSTSQAATIVEAIEIGANTLFFDEDTCANNFMQRDNTMRELVKAEPITPFLSKVRSCYEDEGVSSVLVVGGCGDYLDVADVVVMMENYVAKDVTIRAKEVCSKFCGSAERLSFIEDDNADGRRHRIVHPQFLTPNAKCQTRFKTAISYGDIDIDISGLEQIVSRSQTESILLALHKIATKGQNKTLRAIVDQIDDEIDQLGLEQALQPNSLVGNLSRPRKFEIAGTLSRLRIDGILK